ncbi:hypothetical protein [Moorena sp. SIO1F2]|uniref:hypothetical protein n=1 Tax=Moorena sp. SIO1F2 TaxID=2607819 RepID=UPI0025E65AF6|nr:hypothetical protein [Moorena sp. SIO1F2]
MNLNKFVDPRYDIWMKTATMLEERYLSLDSNVDWDGLQKNIPSASKERIQKIFDKINNSENLNKGERIFLIMLKLLNDTPVNNEAEIIKQLQNHICEIETIFVPWDIVL